MTKEKIELMVEGGKAVATPAVAQKLGPLKINISGVLSEINKKTDSFKGIQVPVKIIIDKSTKAFNIEVGTPPTSELIKKELGLEKGAAEPNKNKIANLSIEQIIKIAKMKKDSMYTEKMVSAVKCVIGTAHSMGILVEGKMAPDLVPKIAGGKFKKEIEEEKIEMPAEKKDLLAQQLKQVQVELEKEFAKLKAIEEAEAAAVAKPEEKKEEVPAEAAAEKVGEAAPAKEGEAAVAKEAKPGEKKEGKGEALKKETPKKEAKPAKEVKKGKE